MVADNYQKYLKAKAKRIKEIVTHYTNFLRNAKDLKLKIITEENHKNDQSEIERIRKNLNGS